MDKLLKKGRPSVIGMVHCLPLPGTAGYGGDMSKILEQAVADAICLEKAGCDTPEDFKMVIDAGADGAFVGSTVLKLYDQPEKLKETVRKFKIQR